MRRTALALLTAGLLAGCATDPPDGPGKPIADPQSIPDAEPKGETPSDSGNPERYTIAGQTYEVMDSAEGHVERGIASWYGRKFHGQKTATGERYDMYAMTAAHRELPLPSYVEVENLDNGREITVRVNDRGPFARNRIIDLSYAAAAKLGMLESGTAPVEIRTVETPQRARESIESTPVPAEATRVDAIDVTTEGTAQPVGKPNPKAGADTKVDYYVQIGAFAQRTNAYRMVGRAETAGLETPIEVNEHRRGEALLYRVQVGPLNSAAAVDRVTEALRQAGIRQSHVVVKAPDDELSGESS